MTPTTGDGHILDCIHGTWGCLAPDQEHQRLLLFLSLCLQDDTNFVRLSEHESCLCQALCLVCIIREP